MANLSPAEALRRFEQSLVPVRTVAGADESFAAYAATALPADLDSAKQVKIQQGFEAGYSAAMDRVRGLLLIAQGEALAAGRIPADPPAPDTGAGTPLTAEEVDAIESRMDVWANYGPDPSETILNLIATVRAAPREAL